MNMFSSLSSKAIYLYFQIKSLKTLCVFPMWMCSAVCILQRRRGESCSPGCCRTAEALLSGACRDQLRTVNLEARSDATTLCFSVHFQNCGPKNEDKNIWKHWAGAATANDSRSKRTRGISVMFVSEAGVAPSLMSLAGRWLWSSARPWAESLSASPTTSRPSLARGAAPTPSPLTCPGPWAGSV